MQKLRVGKFRATFDDKFQFLPHPHLMSFEFADLLRKFWVNAIAFAVVRMTNFSSCEFHTWSRNWIKSQFFLRHFSGEIRREIDNLKMKKFTFLSCHRVSNVKVFPRLFAPLHLVFSCKLKRKFSILFFWHIFFTFSTLFTLYCCSDGVEGAERKQQTKLLQVLKGEKV